MSIFLLAIGAILAFAVDVQVAGLDLDMVGIILMIAGGVWLLLALIVWGPRDNAARTREVRFEPR
ncbi:MAG: DUF6458 family protein [Candidatus Nanopelagicales bacterium]